MTKRNGVLVDFGMDGTNPEWRCDREWCLRNVPSIVFGSNQVVDSAASRVSESALDSAGVYFLVWDNMVCYVGKASVLGDRIEAHRREGRPHDRIAVIAGIPPMARSAVENAYATVWMPPWNCARTDAFAPGSDALVRALQSVDMAFVMPRFPVRGGIDLSFMKAWELHVMGRKQAIGKT